MKPLFIGLHNSDKTKFPNLVLSKLSSWHKAQGDIVEPFVPLKTYDKVYSSKVFTYTKESSLLPPYAIKGGTGYNNFDNLPDCIEHTCPDYGYAGINYSFGFLTRGCIRKCPWCIVPKKEGELHAHADIEEFARHKNVCLMDNNVLAHDHGIQQIEKMTKLGLAVDFNQGLDARLIDKQVAKRLAALKWFKPLRMSCDTKSQMPVIERATKRLRAAGAYPDYYHVYVLFDNIDDAYERVMFLHGLGLKPYAQPYRDFTTNKEPPKELKRFARWVNAKPIFYATSWEDYNKKKTKRDNLCSLW